MAGYIDQAEHKPSARVKGNTHMRPLSQLLAVLSEYKTSLWRQILFTVKKTIPVTGRGGL
jgi:hypothetical protein